MQTAHVLYAPQRRAGPEELAQTAAHRERLIRLGASARKAPSTSPTTAIVMDAPSIPSGDVMPPLSNDLFLAAWLVIEGRKGLVPDRIGVLDIQRAVALHFEVPLDEMISQRRTAHLVLPRQVAMYLAKKLTTRSLPEIGRHFEGRDHTTIIHGVRKIEKLLDINASVKSDIQIIVTAIAPEKKGLFV